MTKPHECVVCKQPWPTGEHRYSEEQTRRQVAACDAKGGVEEATRDIEHLLFALDRVPNAEREDGTTEEHQQWVMDTLLQYARGACESLKEDTEALWREMGLYLWPWRSRAEETTEAETKEQQE
jgi:hypothetical protein